MRKFLSTITMFLCMAFVHAQDFNRDRTALLMVHFGTTYDDTRAKTIDAINDKAREALGQYRVDEAYTSRIVIKRLAKRGIVKPTVQDALFRLRADGYNKVIIQPTFIIDGKEMDMLRDDVAQMRPFFDSIAVGRPLMYSVDDARQVCRLLANRHAAKAAKNSHVLFVGHGTEGPATALYSQLDYLFDAEGYGNCHVATIEGYPTFDTAVAKIKRMKGKNITLVPLLFVAGDHASNDISVEWKEQLEKLGFKVSLAIEGLGEVPQIQDIYIGRIK